jgi:hypothetical protein
MLFMLAPQYTLADIMGQKWDRVRALSYLRHCEYVGAEQALTNSEIT